MPAARIALIAAVAGLIGGLSGALIAQPAGRLIHPTAVTIANTAADALDVSGGLEAGSGDVALVGADGKINGPLSSTILDDLSGANLTALNGSNVSTGTVAAARLPANVVVDVTAGWTATESTTTATTWSTTGLSATITVDNATNDVEIDVWQLMGFAGGSVTCAFRLVQGTTVLWTSATISAGNPYDYRRRFRHTNPGSGSKTYTTEFRRVGGGTNTCIANTNRTGQASGSSLIQVLEIAN